MQSQLKYDQQGFLVGDTVPEIKRMADATQAMARDIAAIKLAVSGISSQRVSQPKITKPSTTTQSAIPTLRRSSSGIPKPMKNVSATPKRDGAGKFTANKSTDTSDGKKTANVDYKVLSRLFNAGKTMTSGAGESIDPTVTAFKEVAEPMKRGYSAFVGGGDSKWLKKIFGTLNVFKKESGTFDKSQAKLLKDISKKPAASGGDSVGFGGVGIMRGFLNVAKIILLGVFSGVGVAITGAGVAAWGIFTDSGQQFFSDVGSKVVGAWDSMVKTFEPVTSAITSGWESVKAGFDGVLNGISSFIKDKLGVDIPKLVAPIVEKVSGAVDSAKGTVKSAAGRASDIITKSSPKTTEAIGNLLGRAKEGISNIGKMSTNKAAMISEMDAQGISDPKERAMLMAQVDHESGGFKYTKELGKDSYFDKYDAGTKKGRELGNTEAGDGAKYKGRGFMQLTGKSNYAAAGKDLGLDLVNHPELAETPENAAKTAMWYWKKNKLGSAAQDGNIDLVTKRINGGTNGKAERESKYANYLSSGTSLPTQTASIATPTSAPRVSTPDPIEKSPGVIIPLGSRNNDRNINVAAADPDVGQDVSDRRIAHIVSGGYSSK